jgi:hypothetical protein
MINNIITGISQKIDEEFNINSDEYTIYTDGVEQGLKEPCFFIFSLKPSNRQLVGNRYERKYPFDIHYFPSTTEINFELNEMVERLYQSMEYIMVNGELIRGTKMNAEIVDDVLHFFINYNLHVIKQVAQEESMEEILIKQNAR